MAGFVLVSRYDTGLPPCLIMQWSSPDLRLTPPFSGNICVWLVLDEMARHHDPKLGAIRV
eukprot:scaffold27384_cov36-Cyclotella_meneghiniana.AAC.5